MQKDFLRRLDFLAILLLGFLAWSLPSIGSAKTLFWEPPTSRVDGSALAAEEIFQYELCIQADSAMDCSPDSEPRFFETTATNVPIESFDLPFGNWYFTVRTVDTNGLKSEWSDFVSHKILAPPNPPSALQIE